MLPEEANLEKKVLECFESRKSYSGGLILPGVFTMSMSVSRLVQQGVASIFAGGLILPGVFTVSMQVSRLVQQGGASK